jgi:hypothetical protein
MDFKSLASASFAARANRTKIILEEYLVCYPSWGNGGTSRIETEINRIHQIKADRQLFTRSCWSLSAAAVTILFIAGRLLSLPLRVLR